MVSILLRKNELKSTAKSGVVLRSGIITETSARLRAMKFAICADRAISPAPKKNRRLSRPMRSRLVRFEAMRKITRSVKVTDVTVTAATNGSGRILSPCLRKVWEMAETRAAPNGNKTSSSRQLAVPLWPEEKAQTLPTIRTVPTYTGTVGCSWRMAHGDGRGKQRLGAAQWAGP